MDPELQKQIDEKLEQLAGITKELDALKQQALSKAYKAKEIPPELGPYRSPGKVEEDSRPPKPKTKRDKPWSAKELLDRAKMFKDKGFLFDTEGMKKCRGRHYRAATEVDTVETLRLYEGLMQCYEAYPPCTLNAKDYLECATFKRGIRNDDKDKKEGK
jgi:hypothetical protein